MHSSRIAPLEGLFLFPLISFLPTLENSPSPLVGFFLFLLISFLPSLSLLLPLPPPLLSLLNLFNLILESLVKLPGVNGFWLRLTEIDARVVAVHAGVVHLQVQLRVRRLVDLGEPSPGGVAHLLLGGGVTLIEKRI